MSHGVHPRGFAVLVCLDIVFGFILDMEETYKEYEDWLGEAPCPNVRQAYDKALAHLGKITPYEEQLVCLCTNTDSFSSGLEQPRTELRTQCQIHCHVLYLFFPLCLTGGYLAFAID